MATYLFQGRTLPAADPSFADALVAAYAGRYRPRCLCLSEGVPMYVTHLGRRHILKRMPLTGHLHAPHCASHELPPGMAGPDSPVDTAITENPVTGVTTLKLGFALSKRAPRLGEPLPAGKPIAARRHDTGLTLRGLLHYLWDQAGLTQWRPGFAGRRSWGTVRKRILLASESLVARGHALSDWLYLPEVFTASRRSEIAERRDAQWTRSSRTRHADQPLWLMLGELKDLRASRVGAKAVIKHVPDLPFTMSPELYEGIGRRFADELLLWEAANDMHLIVLATFVLDQRGIPGIEELSLMPTTAEWLPASDTADLQVVERLLASGRHFRVGLRYDSTAHASLPRTALLDTPPDRYPPTRCSNDVAD